MPYLIAKFFARRRRFFSFLSERWTLALGRRGARLVKVDKIVVGRGDDRRAIADDVSIRVRPVRMEMHINKYGIYI